MYARLPDAAYLKSWGMPASQFAHVYRAQVWPENWQAWRLFESLATQWRASAGGVIGLDYAVMTEEIRLLRLTDAEQAKLRGDIRVLEVAALNEIHADGN